MIVTADMNLESVLMQPYEKNEVAVYEFVKFHDSVISAMFLFEIKIFMNFLAGMVYCFVEIFANLYKFTICVASVGMALVLCVTNCC